MKKQAVILALLFMSLSAHALRNPEAIYCTSLGYGYEITGGALGEFGVCRFAPNEACSAYDFLSGSCGEEYGYCNRSGYVQRVGSGPECGSEDPYTTCALCILGDGSEVEVTKLMDLSFDEAFCGNGVCEDPESVRTCRQDCLAGMEREKISLAAESSPETDSDKVSIAPSGSKSILSHNIMVVIGSFAVFMLLVCMLFLRRRERRT